jgi:glutamine amidotransferase
MVTVIDYEVSNLTSVVQAITALGETPMVIKEPAALEHACKIILPGVGAFPRAMHNLEKHGFKAILREKVLNEKVPILGVCLGMQLLTEKSYEDEETIGLDLVPAQVHRLKPNDPRLRVPHVGWNNIVSTGDNVLFQGNLPQQPDFYFVHSYQVVFPEPLARLTLCDYGGEFVAAFQKENIFGVQFHPELSHKNGLQVLRNFFEYPLATA